MKSNRLFGICSAALLAAGLQPAGAAPAPLDEPHPVEWRGIPLREVFDQLAHELKTPYVVDRAVPAEAMEQRIRLYAAHLTGGQAFRWAARLAGLEAVVRDGMVLLAPPQNLPRLWRLAGESPAEAASAAERRRMLDERRINVTWIDMPLSSIARDISARLGIDVIFHPAILSAGGLVHFEDPDASLKTIRGVLEQQLKAQSEIFDGALWVVPADLEPDIPATRPAVAVDAPPIAANQAEDTKNPMNQFMMVDASIRSWTDFCDLLSRIAGVACRTVPEQAVFGSPLEARGTVAEVLEAARLLGRLTWRWIPGSEIAPPTIEIRPGPANR